MTCHTFPGLSDAQLEELRRDYRKQQKRRQPSIIAMTSADHPTLGNRVSVVYPVPKVEI